MDLQNIIGFSALGLALVIHLIGTVWWASKVTSSLDHLAESLALLNRELEKRDIQISAVWRKLDETREFVFKNVKGGME